MKTASTVPAPRVKRWAFRGHMADGIRDGSISIAVRRHSGLVGGEPKIRVGDVIQAFRWHGLRAGTHVEELGLLEVTVALHVLVHERWFRVQIMDRGPVSPLSPPSRGASDRDDFARNICGWPSWEDLLSFAMGRRRVYPTKGVPLTVVHWRRRKT